MYIVYPDLGSLFSWQEYECQTAEREEVGVQAEERPPDPEVAAKRLNT